MMEMFVAISKSRASAFEHLMFVAALAVVSVVVWVLHRRLKGLPMVVVALLVTHPAFLLSSYGADRGAFQTQVATAFTVVAGLCVVVQLVVWSRPGLKAK